jgi:adenylate kinase family enzyme
LILDGYPRSLEQAAKLTRTLAARDTNIDTPTPLLTQNTLRQSRALGRIRLRRQASECDETGFFSSGTGVRNTAFDLGLHQPLSAPAFP